MPPFYCMVDRPGFKFNSTPKRAGDRRVRQTNKPRREHPTLQIAETEAKRLARVTKSRVLVLEVVKVHTPDEKEEAQASACTASKAALGTSQEQA